MKRIRSLYNKLVHLPCDGTTLKEYDEINEVLVEIGKELINSTLDINGHKVQPIWVEAYLYNPNTRYRDPLMYAEDGQRGSKYFYHLYPLPKSANFQGMDIVIGDKNDVYLAYLMKKTIIDGEVCNQPKTAGKLKGSPIVPIKFIDYKKQESNNVRRIFGKNPKGHKHVDDDREHFENYVLFELAIFNSEYFKFKKDPKEYNPKTIYNKCKE